MDFKIILNLKNILELFILDLYKIILFIRRIDFLFE